MRKKAIHAFIGVLFFLFAMVQYNDADFYIWMPTYGIISFIAISVYFGRYQNKLALGLTLFLTIWSFTFFPDLANWVNEGTPNIAGSMQAESPHIELMRELFGLIICIAAAIYYAMLKKPN